MFQNCFTGCLTEKPLGLQGWAIPTMNRGLYAPPDFYSLIFTHLLIQALHTLGWTLQWQLSRNSYSVLSYISGMTLDEHQFSPLCLPCLQSHYKFHRTGSQIKKKYDVARQCKIKIRGQISTVIGQCACLPHLCFRVGRPKITTASFWFQNLYFSFPYRAEGLLFPVFTFSLFLWAVNHE